MEWIRLDETCVHVAGHIHAESWRESHRSFCTEEFVQQHTDLAQTEYLRREMQAGKDVYMLIDWQPVGIVSVFGGLIENLYVLPSEQNKGYGTMLLQYAIGQSTQTPTLWILENNEGAERLYTRHGFRRTGKQNRLSAWLYEIEMALL